VIDFRSDTVTKPTEAMRKAMAEAIVGDDVYGDDPTVNRLEETAAAILGKEAALFVPSGTMGNQIAIMSHTKRGDEVILGRNCHIKTYEVGAAAVLAGVNFHTVDDSSGMLDFDETTNAIRGENIHFPDTGLICTEMAHGSGKVADLEKLQAIHTLAGAHGIPHHLDGARVFNAAVRLQIDVKTIANMTDSVMFCLSKGLGAPVGSILTGDRPFIEKARKYRKMLGGGMRQAGILAAAGLIALESMRKRLDVDHALALHLAQELKKLSHFTVDETALDINMVFLKTTHDKPALIRFLADEGILIGQPKGDTLRLVIHNDIKEADVTYLLEKLNSL